MIVSVPLSAIGPPDSRGPVRFAGGIGAPRRARRSVLSQLTDQPAQRRASDAALIVSELVTNSVVHANVTAHETLIVELDTVGDQLRITVIDNGSPLEPRIRRSDHSTPGGFGLRLVDELSSAWGVRRDRIGTTSVWCELALDQ